MELLSKYSKHLVALLLTGSATLLISCGGGKSGQPNPENLITQESDSLFVIESRNGLKSYRFKAPKRISYGLAREPYTVYPQGVFVESFRDSTTEVESTLIADFAIQHDKSKLWEAIGNVVATGEDGRTLYTEQLFWNERTERIYSNVDCKIVQKDGAYIGDGFESDQTLKHWTFRNTVSKIAVDPPSGGGGASQDGGSSSGGLHSGDSSVDGLPASGHSSDVPLSGGSISDDLSSAPQDIGQNEQKPNAPAHNSPDPTKPNRTDPEQNIPEGSERRRTIQPTEDDGPEFQAELGR